jgi:hypothetical protein
MNKGMGKGLFILDEYGSRVFDVRIPRQVRYFNERYGRYPKVVRVNPVVHPEMKTVSIDKHRIKIIPDEGIEPDLTWLGNEASNGG